MIVLSAQHIAKAFGGTDILLDASLTLQSRERIGLVGVNGCGKSTFLKILTGELQPDGGTISMARQLRLGYLAQQCPVIKGQTVYQVMDAVFEPVRSMEARLRTLEGQMADADEAALRQLGEQYTRLNQAFEDAGGYDYRSRIQGVLKGLGFGEAMQNQDAGLLSGGELTRLYLARLLLSRPDVLLLDEPTNHLDIESIEWFEDYLKAYRGSLLLVSHDRKFLDNVTKRTVEILLGHIHDYKVPYSQYVALRAERIAQQVAAYENQQRMIEKTEDFINRFRYKPTKSNQVQSRIKALEKLERIEIDETDGSTLSLKFPPALRSGDVVFKGTDLTVGYPQKVVFSHADIEIKRGEKVALIGRNGEGKTTLMRVIMGELEPMEGEARLGHNVQIGYYAQNQEEVLDPSLTVYDTLDRIAVGDIRTRLRDILGAFLFKGEDIDKKVSVLSGGERARLGMAKLMLESHNVLALDEPTNHMDIRSKDVLKQALLSFDGTLVVVSHDRDFLDGLVDKLYEFRDGKVKEHLGSVADFLEKRKLESLQELERHLKEIPEAPAPEQKEVRKQEYQARKAVSKEERKIRSRVSFLEKEIARCEGRMGEIEKVLSAPGGKQEDILDLTAEYLNLKRDMDAYTEEWANLSEQLDN